MEIKSHTNSQVHIEPPAHGKKQGQVLWQTRNVYYKNENCRGGFWVFRFELFDDMGNVMTSYEVFSQKSLKKYSDKTKNKYHPDFHKA